VGRVELLSFPRCPNVDLTPSGFGWHLLYSVGDPSGRRSISPQQTLRYVEHAKALSSHQSKKRGSSGLNVPKSRQDHRAASVPDVIEIRRFRANGN
jgi:hypothetical protein